MVDVHSQDFCLPKSPAHVMEPSFSGGGWASAQGWEAVKECLVWPCLCARLLLYPSNSPFLNPAIFPILLLKFSPQN